LSVPYIKTPRDARNIFQKIGARFFGVGVNAYMRIAPVFFIPGYRLISFRNVRELEFIERLAPVYNIERDLGVGALGSDGPVNTVSILSHPPVQNHVASAGPEVALILYKSYPQLEEMAKKHGWRLMANPSELRERLENKLAFRKTLKLLKLPVIPGENVPVSALDGTRFDALRRLYGETLIFQIPEITNGGGRGTFRLDSREAFQAFQDFMNGRAHYGETAPSVNALAYIPGVPCSVSGCVTRHGTLLTPLQAQITNAREVIDLKTRWGAFCGHSWGAPNFSPHIRKSAGDMALRLAGYLRETGFKGVFGVDFIAREDDGAVYPVELNARYTGALPMLSLLHIQKGIAPLDVFHVLEFLNADYDADIRRLNHEYGQGVEGGHIILFNKRGRNVTVDGELKAGTHRFDAGRGELEYRKPGLFYQDMENGADVVITDGAPFRGAFIASGDEFSRVLRILFPKPITDQGARLTPETVRIIERAYKLLDLRPADETADEKPGEEPV